MFSPLDIATPRPTDPLPFMFCVGEGVWHMPTATRATIRRLLCSARVVVELEDGTFAISHLSDVRKR